MFDRWWGEAEDNQDSRHDETELSEGGGKKKFGRARGKLKRVFKRVAFGGPEIASKKGRERPKGS